MKKHGFIYLRLLLLIVIAMQAGGCSSRPKYRIKNFPEDVGNKKYGDYTAEGIASYYGKKFHGKPTASGEKFDMYADTAAHNTLPFGTIVRVTNLENGKSVEVKINDRGPFVKGRIVDLSYGAAEKLGMLVDGIVKVRIQEIR